jgi:hypothetical protein
LPDVAVAWLGLAPLLAGAVCAAAGAVCAVAAAACALAFPELAVELPPTNTEVELVFWVLTGPLPPPVVALLNWLFETVTCDWPTFAVALPLVAFAIMLATHGGGPFPAPLPVPVPPWLPPPLPPVGQGGLLPPELPPVGQGGLLPPELPPLGGVG